MPATELPRVLATAYVLRSPHRRVQVRGGCEALIDERFPGVTARSWQRVAPDAIIDHKDNPTGGAVACWHQGEVLCFVRAEET